MLQTFHTKVFDALCLVVFVAQHRTAKCFNGRHNSVTSFTCNGSTRCAMCCIVWKLPHEFGSDNESLIIAISSLSAYEGGAEFWLLNLKPLKRRFCRVLSHWSVQRLGLRCRPTCSSSYTSNYPLKSYRRPLLDSPGRMILLRELRAMSRPPLRRDKS